MEKKILLALNTSEDKLDKVYVVMYSSHVSTEIVKICKTEVVAIGVAADKMWELASDDAFDFIKVDNELSWTHDRLGDVWITTEELGD